MAAGAVTSSVAADQLMVKLVLVAPETLVAPADLSRARRDFTVDSAQQGRFPCPIRPGKAQLDPRSQREVYVAKNFATAQRHGQVFDFNQALCLTSGRVEGNSSRRSARAHRPSRR